ncbi:MAG: SH3 domain-containing protein [Acidobacteriia bacterium]|nr:SH3 domain-containing protein [Terriglobia bacterium]
MKTILREVVLWGLVLVSCAACMWAQEATAKRNLVVRRDPSKSSPAIDHVAKDDRLTLVRKRADNGYYHVKTEQDVIGWVLASGVTVSQPPPTPPAPPVQPPPSGQCDDTLWSHVYHSNRLVVNQKCISVTGTIVDATNGREHDGIRHEADGDTHGWLKVDAQFQNLLNAGNISAEGGNLVFEIVCKYPVTQADAKTACSNYHNKVTIPPVGSHVRIVGVYVQDTFHAQWMEIHPVTSIAIE